MSIFIVNETVDSFDIFSANGRNELIKTSISIQFDPEKDEIENTTIGTTFLKMIMPNSTVD
jgi:hypothetical protein